MSVSRCKIVKGWLAVGGRDSGLSTPREGTAASQDGFPAFLGPLPPAPDSGLGGPQGEGQRLQAVSFV